MHLSDDYFVLTNLLVCMSCAKISGIRTTLVGDAVLIEKRSDIEKRNKAEKSELQAEKDVVNVERGFETAPARREGLGVYSDQ